MPFVYMPDQQYGPPNPYQPYPPMIPPDIEARATKIAMKLMAKEAKKKAKTEEDKEKKKADEKKQLEAKRSINLLSIEWFVLGLLLYPVVGPAYNIIIHYLQSYSIGK